MIDYLNSYDPDLRNVAFDLTSALRAYPDIRKLPSATGRRNLLDDLSGLIYFIGSDAFDIDRLLPLLKAIWNRAADDAIWDRVYAVIVEVAPPPKLVAFPDQTSYSHTTSSFVNSSEQRKYTDAVLRQELGSIFVGVPGFFEVFYHGIEGLQTKAEAVLQECKRGDNALFHNETGWQGWPPNAEEKDVLTWLTRIFKDIMKLVSDHTSDFKPRTILARPSKPLEGSSAKRKLDVAIARNQERAIGVSHHWSQVLFPGELKSSADLDTASNTWRDLGRYVREAFTAQDTRRFVLGFTLCGSVMRLWEFDRIGAIASSPFDINSEPLQFISAVVGFLLMNDEQLGFDPSIISSEDGERFIRIHRDGRDERLILEKLVKPSACVAGRATTCWKAHLDDEARTPVIVKDSWQYPERAEEGEILQDIGAQGVVSVARYFHHQTVKVHGEVDDVRNNVRKGLDVTKASNWRQVRSPVTESRDVSRRGSTRKASSLGQKRSSSHTEASLPPSKRSCSPAHWGDQPLQNRVHRRVCVRDYGKSIYRASSRVALLNALEACVEGYESLHTKAGVLQGDISTGNLIINEEHNGSWSAFLIDMDLAIRERRDQASGARGKTGTRAFMAIGLLLGEKHSFWHDLESFFWVLFWICIHYDGPGKDIGPTDFDCWNYDDDQKLANSKKGIVADETDFEQTARKYFTPYYQSLVPWVNRLRRVNFPEGSRRKSSDTGIYGQIKHVLRRAAEDVEVIGEI
ncbi:hypothetical protein P170DRAFT_418244 [Aspergillus steynii IBT 23096]|uniref:Fungal-type protein kinase domain-containing protein n=1 Tax=Aspergillus steynii IBT 23096 TaxID=1392250 RepID=A0A2I2FTF5_9EURO|nr:uncharacterized protein P170DRAFT_418244 [Aspergillus steynii IBT 23096]PLB43857.1 hypothetical protein P170DRAFT_418244 [Aspergillus steynii IBT 23096]